MITLGDVALDLPTAGLALFIEQYYPLDDASLFGTYPTALHSNRSGSRGRDSIIQGLGLPPYPDPPKPKLNHLYWPTGASRWARGLFVCDSESLDKIIEKIGDSSDPSLTLKIKEEVSEAEVTAKVYLLNPRPLTVSADEEAVTLFLLPLVCQRYFWQWFSSGPDLDVANGTTWEDLISDVATAVGAGVANQDTVSVDYGTPDPEETERLEENPAVLLDALAHSVGMRCIWRMDGTLDVTNWETAEAAYGSSMATSGDLAPWHLATGERHDKYLRTSYPETVRVVFPKYIEEFRTLTQGQVYAEDIAIADAAPGDVEHGGGFPDSVKLIYTTAMANYVYDTGALESTVDNASEVTALATQIATDYYAGLTYQYDHTFQALKKWTLGGYDDALEYYLQAMDAQGVVRLQTRVWSKSPNFDAEEMLHQFQFTIDIPFARAPSILRVDLDGALSQGDYATASVTDLDGNDKGHTVVVFERLLASGADDIASGSACFVEPVMDDNDDLKWVVTAAECPAA